MMLKNLFIAAITVIVLGVGVHIVDRALPQAAVTNAAGGALTARPERAEMPPDAVFQDLQGKSVRLADFRGKVVLLDFWATWCEPCKIEIPWLIEFQRKYAAKDFVVLGVAMDEEGKYVVEPYLQTERFDVDGRQEAINYQILLGTPEIGDKFGINGYPTGVLISRDGHLISTIEGLTGHDALAREIEKLF
jgi:thiol-disulfide isomerase/thioredoxin